MLQLHPSTGHPSIQCHPPKLSWWCCVTPPCLYQISTTVNGHNRIPNGWYNPRRLHCFHVHHMRLTCWKDQEGCWHAVLAWSYSLCVPQQCLSSNSVAQYWQYRESLHESDGVVIYNYRAVIPGSLQPAILVALHSVYQGVSLMEAWAWARSHPKELQTLYS